jgi:hypothetical protein
MMEGMGMWSNTHLAGTRPCAPSTPVDTVHICCQGFDACSILRWGRHLIWKTPASLVGNAGGALLPPDVPLPPAALAAGPVPVTVPPLPLPLLPKTADTTSISSVDGA